MLMSQRMSKENKEPLSELIFIFRNCNLLIITVRLGIIYKYKNY